MPLPRFWYLPRGLKAAVVLTGDDHDYNLGGTNGQFNRYLADSPPGCSVALWQCVRSTSYLFPGTSVSNAAGGGLPDPGLRDRAAPAGCRATPPGRRPATATATTSRAPRPSATTSPQQLAALPPTYPSIVAPATQPQPLHRLQRLVQRAARRAGAGHPPRHELLLLARRRGSRTAPGFFTGSGFPHALRRDRRLAHRRLPGRHAAHRRVRTGHRQRDQGPARQRARRPPATTASSRPTCTPTSRRQPRRRRDHRRRPGARGARRLGTPDAHLARRPQHVVLPGPVVQRRAPELQRRPGRRRAPGCRRCSPRAGRPAPLQALARNGQPVGLRDADDQGHRLRDLPRGRRLLRRHLPRPARPAPAARRPGRASKQAARIKTVEVLPRAHGGADLPAPEDQHARSCGRAAGARWPSPSA